MFNIIYHSKRDIHEKSIIRNYSIYQSIVIKKGNDFNLESMIFLKYIIINCRRRLRAMKRSAVFYEQIAFCRSFGSRLRNNLCDWDGTWHRNWMAPLVFNFCAINITLIRK